MGFIEKMMAEYKDDIIDKIFDDELQEKLVKALNNSSN